MMMIYKNALESMTLIVGRDAFTGWTKRSALNVKSKLDAVRGVVELACLDVWSMYARGYDDGLWSGRPVDTIRMSCQSRGRTLVVVVPSVNVIRVSLPGGCKVHQLRASEVD